MLPRHVGEDEERDDDDCDVGHVELLPVARGSSLVEDADAAADAQVEHDQDEHRRQARRRQGVELKDWKGIFSITGLYFDDNNLAFLCVRPRWQERTLKAQIFFSTDKARFNFLESRGVWRGKKYKLIRKAFSVFFSLLHLRDGGMFSPLLFSHSLGFFRCEKNSSFFAFMAAKAVAHFSAAPFFPVQKMPFQLV